MKKFLLLDDHVVVRSGIRGLLLEVFTPCEIHEGDDGESAIESLKKHEYDLVIMDIKMPKTDSLGLMDYIHTRYPKAKALIFSMGAETIFAKRFLKAGAKGFLSKQAKVEEIKKAINLVLNGRKYISESLALSLAEDSYSDKNLNPFEKISAREFEILYLLLAGHTVSEISKSLHVHVSTVGTHKTRVFEKLGVSNILDLKALADSFDI